MVPDVWIFGSHTECSGHHGAAVHILNVIDRRTHDIRRTISGRRMSIRFREDWDDCSGWYDVRAVQSSGPECIARIDDQRDGAVNQLVRKRRVIRNEHGGIEGLQ